MIDVVVTVGGWVGAVCVLVAYGLIANGRLRARSAAFHILNVLGAVLLLGNSAFYGAWPSVGVNGVWCIIGVVALVGVYTHRGRTPPPHNIPTEGTAL